MHDVSLNFIIIIDFFLGVYNLIAPNLSLRDNWAFW